MDLFFSDILTAIIYYTDKWHAAVIGNEMKNKDYWLFKIQIILVLFTLFMWKQMIESRRIENEIADLGFQRYPGINIKEF